MMEKVIESERFNATSAYWEILKMDRNYKGEKKWTINM
jgi:hypothetical protein